MNTSAPPIGVDLAQRFLVRRENVITGPFDLVELAASLRAGEITPATDVRLEGKTLWLPLATLPEFPLLQAMPVETLAFHLEQKANAGKPRQTWIWYQSIPFLLFLFGAILFIAVLSLIYSGPGVPTPPPEPPLAHWIRTTIGGLSIDAPVELRPLPTKNSPYLTGYWTDTVDAHFDVDIRFAHVPDNPAELESGFDQFVLHFLLANKAKLLTETPITVNGHQGRDVLFTSDEFGTVMPGGLRILAGKEELAMAWTVSHTNKFGPDEINRFITSFHFN